MISIIVPIYNASNTIEKCIYSILSQSYKNWELLLIDDGSTDLSGEICEKFSKIDNRIKTFHKKNGGVSSARNLGILNTTGDHILFIDADDWIEEKYLERFMNKAEYDLVVSSFIYEYPGNTATFECKVTCCNNKESIGTTLKEIDPYMGITVPWCKMYKTKIIISNNLRFDERASSGEDTLFVYNYIKYINSLCTIKSTDYHYIASGGLSKKPLEIESIIYIINELTKTFNDLNYIINYDTNPIKYQVIQNFISKYDISQKGISKIYYDLNRLLSYEFAKDMINDKQYIPKGSIRKTFDYLARHNLLRILALFCKATGRFYA